MGKVIGIDLGTTNSCMAAIEGGEPAVIPNAEGGRTTPSVVAFTKDGQRLVGAPAKRQQVTNPENTVFSIKRFMGRKFDEVSEEMTIVPYEVTKGPNEDVRVKAGGKEYAPPEISAMILQKLKTDAEAYLGEEVTDAVITVPAYFNNAQREATKDAGKIAGLNVLRIINEPTAASLAYGLDKEADQTILVFDLGGGTFDVSVLELGDGTFHVKATSGDNHLGGDNFDKAVVDWLVAEFKKDHGADLSQDPVALQRLYDAAEKAKIELSSTMTTQINLPFIAEGPKHLDMQLTRAKLLELTAELLERTVGPTKQVIADAGLVRIRHRARRARRRHDPHACRAGEGHGAARQGAAQGRQPGRGGRRRRRHPGRRHARRGEGRPPARRDAAVARHRDEGRRLHDSSSSATRRSPTASRRCSRRPRTTSRRSRSTCSRASRRWRCTTRRSGSSSSWASRRRRAACRRSRSTFDIDANGIINVSAKDLGTGNEQQIRIEGGSGLKPEEVERMMKEAEAHAGEAHAMRELADAKNMAENLVYQTEKALKENREALDESVASTIEGRIMELNEALKGSDLAEVKAKTDALVEASHSLAEAVYAKASEQSALPADGDGAAGDDGGRRGRRLRGRDEEAK